MDTIPDCPKCGNNTVSCEMDFNDTFRHKGWDRFSKPFEIWYCKKCKTKYKVQFNVTNVEIL